jgi:hypothetical protein
MIRCPCFHNTRRPYYVFIVFVCVLLDLNGLARWSRDDPGAVGVVEVGVRVQGRAEHEVRTLYRYI